MSVPRSKVNVDTHYIDTHNIYLIFVPAEEIAPDALFPPSLKAADVFW